MKYNLVPISTLQATNQNTKEPEVPRPTIYEPTRAENPFESLVELLPKRYRQKATVIAHYLNGNIQLDPNQRIIYEDGSSGSHFLDLMRYFVYPKSIKVSRPIDAVRFGLLLKSMGVPDFAIRKEISLVPDFAISKEVTLKQNDVNGKTKKSQTKHSSKKKPTIKRNGRKGKQLTNWRNL